MLRKVGVLVAVVAAGMLVTMGTGTTQEKYPPSKHLVQVTKTFEGDVPDEASFVVNVCGHTLNFGEEGGTQTVDVGSDTFTCAVGETDDGGADSVDVDGSPCVFTEDVIPEYVADAPIELLPDQVCSVTITNEYDTPPVEITPPPEIIVSPPEIITIPVPVLRTPQFTG